MTTSEKEIQKQHATLVAFQDTLVPGAVKAAMTDAGAKSSDLWRVPRSFIKVRPGYNPRFSTPDYQKGLELLADSMVENGFYDGKPLTVSVGEDEGKPVLWLEDGHRRFAAAELAVKRGRQLDTLPVVTLQRSMSADDRIVHMYHSNQDTSPFSPLEVAVLVHRLGMNGNDNQAVAKKLGITEAYVRQLQTLNAAPKLVRDMVAEGEISATLAIESVAEHKGEAAAVLSDAKEEAKAMGKRVTAKVVKKVAAKRAAKKPLTPKQQAEVAAAKSERKQREHALEAFALLKEIMDKHGKVIDSGFHARADALFVDCGVI